MASMPLGGGGAVRCLGGATRIGTAGVRRTALRSSPTAGAAAAPLSGFSSGGGGLARSLNNNKPIVVVRRCRLIARAEAADAGRA